ncbi:hypothetical protein [Mycobacterium kansasii]|uniref:hypothetical protein n=1 Tax=Mycobacterium kansasii TaxID=1768 RepID=UPI0015E1D989|nr:hypothetical protein [Mycobacterium kansasii]
MTTRPDKPEFPPELARCTCGTASFDPDDHANTCRLGTTPSLSSDPLAAADLRPPEWRF